MAIAIALTRRQARTRAKTHMVRVEKIAARFQPGTTVRIKSFQRLWLQPGKHAGHRYGVKARRYSLTSARSWRRRQKPSAFCLAPEKSPPGRGQPSWKDLHVGCVDGPKLCPLGRGNAVYGRYPACCRSPRASNFSTKASLRPLNPIVSWRQPLHITRQ